MSEAVIKHAGKNIEVTASLPHEMQQCQQHLIAWCQKKISEIRYTIQEAKEEMAIAVKNKWRSKPWDRQIKMNEKRIVFFGKIMAALKAGYSIVPNFPIDLFAIRTAVDNPKGHETSWHSDFNQSAGVLPPGEGEYKNPFPVVYEREAYEMKEGVAKPTGKRYWPGPWDEMEFPVAMAKPNIMKSTAEAMKAGLFDQFGICPPTKRQDPMIVAQILDPKPRGYKGRGRTIVSFLISWHFDSSIFD